jgi:hypothetical protein
LGLACPQREHEHAISIAIVRRRIG